MEPRLCSGNIPRLGQAKTAHLGYALPTTSALQSGQVQAGRPLNPLRGTAARLFLLAPLRSNAPSAPLASADRVRERQVP